MDAGFKCTSCTKVVVCIAMLVFAWIHGTIVLDVIVIARGNRGGILEVRRIYGGVGLLGNKVWASFI